MTNAAYTIALILAIYEIIKLSLKDDKKGEKQ